MPAHTPSVEYRTTLAALMLAQVVIAARMTARAGEGSQWVIPAVETSDDMSQWTETRVITNRPTDHLTASGGTVINTGGYRPYFLDSIGVQYEVHIQTIPKKRLGSKNIAKYLAMTKASFRGYSFVYVEGDHLVCFFIYRDDDTIVTDMKEFADICGLVIGNSAKINKRLKELVRLSRFFGEFDKLDIRKFESVNPKLTQMSVDGATIIRKSVALRTCPDQQTRMQIQRGHVRRVSIRVMTPKGLIKGDALIVPDGQLKCDVYTSRHNVKDELCRKKGYPITITMEPHHAASPAWTNDQVLSWFSGLFPLDQLRESTKRFLAETLDKLRAGEYPTHLVSLPKTKDGIDQIALFRMSSHKWLAHGLEMNQSAALVRQAGTAVTKQLLSEPEVKFRKDGSPYRDYSKQEVHVPIVHAFYGHFMTDTVIRLAGYTIPKAAEGKLFYHAETHSVVIPAEHFAQYYRNHGGWDLDDSAMVIIRKIDGVVKAIIVRSPNSWGEYSIIDVHLPGLPLFFEYGDIPEVSSAVLPTQIQDLDIIEPERDRTGPPSTYVRDPEYGLRDADYALECAVNNPGTGSLINLLCIAPNAIFGTYSRDPSADTEYVVDTTQGAIYLEGVLWLANCAKGLQETLVAHGEDGHPVDRLVFERRLNLSDKDKAKYRSRWNLVEGLFSQVKSMVLEERGSYNTQLNALAIGERKRLNIGWINYSSVRGTEGMIWRGFSRASDAAHKAIVPSLQREVWRNHNQLLIRKLMETEESRRDLVVLNYLHWCYQEGKNDTALFSPPAVSDDGVVELAVIDLLLEALVRRGLAVKPS